MKGSKNAIPFDQNTNALKRFSVVMIFLYALYVLPPYINLHNQRKSGRITTMKESTKEDADKLMKLFLYDQRGDDIISAQEDEIDVSHFQSAKGHYLHFLQGLRDSIGQPISMSARNRVKIISSFEYETINMQLDVLLVQNSIKLLAKDLGSTYDEAMQVLSAIFTLALLESLEVEQSKSVVTHTLTRSGHSSLDYRGNVTGLRSGIKKGSTNQGGAGFDRIFELLSEYMRVTGSKSAIEGIAHLGKNYGVMYEISNTPVEGQKE